METWKKEEQMEYDWALDCENTWGYDEEYSEYLDMLSDLREMNC